MIAADQPIQRPVDAKLLTIDAGGTIVHTVRSRFVDVLRAGDVIVANDAATLPASLCGRHGRTGARIELRLAGRRSLAPNAVEEFVAIVFGDGDFHTRTEDRPLPPSLRIGDVLEIGPLTATVAALSDHPRLVSIAFSAPIDDIWAGIAAEGRPVQYAHVPTPLALWDVWSPIAAVPAAFEPPSASFVIDWQMLRAMRARGIDFVTLTHAAGLSSTGDPALDDKLPFDEPYFIPPATAAKIARAKTDGRRVVAIGTTVVRALESAGSEGGVVRAGHGLATGRIGAGTTLRIADAILSGTHEPGTSHYELLRAFAQDRVLKRASAELDARGYLTHEFGDSVLIERRRFERACSAQLLEKRACDCRERAA